MNGKYVNEDHNEAVQVEYSLSDIENAVTDLSNYLYNRNPDHPLLEEIAGITRSVSEVSSEAYYEALKDDDWWTEK